MLTDNLPPEAAIWRSDPPTFNRQDELMAVLIEEVGRWPRYAMQMKGVKSHKLPPLREVRPKPAPRVTNDPAEIAAFLKSRLS